MRTNLCPALTTRLTVLRESWPARAPHDHRARPKTYPAALHRLYNQYSLYSQRLQATTARCRVLIHQSSPTTMPSPLCRKISLPEWEELPDLPPDLPLHPQTNGVKQVNSRNALIVSLMSSEAMVETRGYHILDAEPVDELKRVRVPFLFPAFLHHKLFHHRST